MARKRMIDPEFWSDEEIGAWSYQAKLFYIGLWNFADDEGRFKSHPKLLKSQIFPYNKVDVVKLSKEIVNKVQFYEVDGLQYGFLRNFHKYQRIDKPTPSKLPPPEFQEDSKSTPRVLPPKLSKVKLSKDKLSKDKDVGFSFESIFIKYPKKIGKKEAERHFKTTVKTMEDFALITVALEHYLKSERVANGFVQNASTWFNNWQDWVDFEETKKPKQQSFPNINKMCEDRIGKHASTDMIIALLRDVPDKYWGSINMFLRKRYPEDGALAFTKAESAVLRNE